MATSPFSTEIPDISCQTKPQSDDAFCFKENALPALGESPLYSMLSDDNRLLSVHDLATRKGITPEEAALNRGLGKRQGRKPRAERRGLLGVSQYQLAAWVRRGEFPAPIEINPRVFRWLASDVRAWIEQRHAMRDTAERRLARQKALRERIVADAVAAFTKPDA